MDKTWLAKTCLRIHYLPEGAEHRRGDHRSALTRQRTRLAQKTSFEWLLCQQPDVIRIAVDCQGFCRGALMAAARALGHDVLATMSRAVSKSRSLFRQLRPHRHDAENSLATQRGRHRPAVIAAGLIFVSPADPAMGKKLVAADGVLRH
jgi:hypothetical protein